MKGSSFLLINDSYSCIGGAEMYLFSLHQLLKKYNNEAHIFSMGAQEIRSNNVMVAQETIPRKKLFDSKNLKDITIWMLRKSNNKFDYLEWVKNIISPSNGVQESITKYQYIQTFGHYYIDNIIEKKLNNFIKEINPSIVHIHNNYKYPVSVYSGLKSVNIPVVKTVHDFGMICPKSWCVKPDGVICEGGMSEKCVEAGCVKNRYYTLMKPVNKIVNDLEKKSVKLFITPSKVLKQKMEEHGFNNVVNISNFIKTDDYKVDFSKIETGNILYIGGLTEHKGVHYLIEAFSYVLREFPDAQLNIIGSGPFKSCLENKARQLELSDHVIFHGRASDEIVKKFYHKANVIVVPSIWLENSPMVIYEAMASGRPVVGSRIGGIPELVRDGKTGYLTEPRDPQDIAKKVIKIISDGNLAQRFGKTARKIAIDEYSPETHYENLNKVYQNI